MFAFDSVADQLRVISPRRQGGRASFREAEKRRAKWLSFNDLRALVKAVKANPRCGRLIRRDHVVVLDRRTGGASSLLS